jgi:hypothetical protein
MSTTSNPYRGSRFPADIINQAVWLYHCFSLSLREVELILAARGGFCRNFWQKQGRHAPVPTKISGVSDLSCDNDRVSLRAADCAQV